MSKIFSAKNKIIIENNVLSALNNTSLTNQYTSNDPRSVGGAVQTFLEENIVNLIPSNLVKSINTSFARRSMADLAFEDIEDKYYIVDIKTHNLDTKFNMPNLTSVERLSRFYGEDRNYFTLLLISYNIENQKINFDKCKFIPIENLDWSCLTIGALGWGQMQIANSNNIVINEKNTRKKWMLELCDALDLFYPNEISKITERIEHFKKIREFWESK
ncbi:hypothetical protein FACS1894178_5980 [Bacteroidia bacterium]|nr:hypothetical protein FACS1894178_5980 [Bacteroidia bacterium]